MLPIPSKAKEPQRIKSDHIPPAVARLAAKGNLPGSQKMNLAIGLPLRNPEELDQLLQQLYDPASSNYCRYLTPEQFTERFGPTEADYQAVLDFATSNGLAVTVTHPNRMVVDVAGPVMEIQKAFHLNLRVYKHPHEARDFYAPNVEPSVDLAVPILHVSGLENYSLPHPKFKVKPADLIANQTPNSGSGPGGTYRGGDFRAAYVPGTTLTGAGQSVGLLQFDGYYASDITTYATQAGLRVVPITNVPIDGGVTTPGSGNGEVCLDIDMAMMMAPGLSRIYVYEAPNPSPWVDLLNRMATDNLSKQLSCSWGGGSPDPTSEQVFKQMAAQGQSFFNATGDSDAFTAAIEFPSDSTNITEVGGTTLTTGTGAAYASETTWNWGSRSGSYVGSSGGISTYFGMPSYQQGISMSANQGSTTKRNVPDVALTGDNVYVVSDNGTSGTVGGTSCAAPLWAGYTALVNQQAAAAGRAPVGFLNPALYNIARGASYTSNFHDITTGNNFSSTSPSKFSAVAGFDLCTGLGTPNGTNLINALAGPPILAPLLVSNSFTLVAEGCANSAIDPAETVTVSFGLKNIGNVNTTNLVATLLPAGGILSPGAPQTYGVLVTNGTAVARQFSFTATGSCGGSNTASLQLQDGTANLGTVTFSYQLGQLTVANFFSQSFDSVTAPALPAGWTSSASGGQSNWVTSTAARDTAPNSAFATESAAVGVNELDSPAMVLPAGPAQLTFRHNYNLEPGYDGGVLEIKINSGAWTDILTAGGSFVSGGYISTLSSAYNNPLGGRSAWTGSSGGFITTLANLPASAAGQSIQLRWRCGTDNSITKTGWYVDTVSITSSTYSCCTASTDLAVSSSASPDPVLTGQNLTYTLTVANVGPASASSVTLTDALPDSVTFVAASPGCVYLNGKVVCNVGSLASGSTSNFTVVVTPALGGLITNTLMVASPTSDSDPANNIATTITTVDAPPSITLQPGNVAVLPGSNAVFQVTALGSAPLSFQWQFYGTNLSGAVDATLTLDHVQLAQAGPYAVLVTNAFGSILSATAMLTVLDPWIVVQPKDQSVAAGASASFSVSAVGTPPFTYLWRKGGVALIDGTNISGADTATLTVEQVQVQDMGNYSVVVTNPNGTVISSNAALVTSFPAAIVAQPTPQTIPAGSNVSFTAEVVGSSPITLQWQHAGTNLLDGGKFSGVATASLSVSNVQAGEMGIYALVVSNEFGSVISSNAPLTIWPLLGWGRNDYAQSDIPAGLTSATAISAGYQHTLILGTNGTVTAWGAGTVNSGSSPNFGQALVPAGLSNVAAVATGLFHSLALRADGTVAAWGAGTVNTGASPQYGQSLVPATLTNVTMIAAGGYHSVALKRDGTVVAWGANTYGQTNVPNDLTNAVAIAAGRYHTLAVKADGTILTWGAGITNTGSVPDYGQSAVPGDLTNVVAVAAGSYHSLALKGDGTVVAWGYNSVGQTNVPAGSSNVVAVAAGLYHSLGLEADGTVLAWGDNSYGQTNIPSGLANAVRIAGGAYHNIILESDGRPTLTVQPVSQHVAAGASVQLVALAAGLQPLSYQWTFDGTNLPGATANLLILNNVQAALAGNYALVITNSVGSVTSAVASVTVPSSPIISGVRLSGQGVSISFLSEFGLSYMLEYKHFFDDPTWTPLPPAVLGIGGVMTLQDTNASTGSRFYRLRRD